MTTGTLELRSWRERNDWIADLLKRRTGADLETWNARIRELDIVDAPALRARLREKDVTGYPQDLLVMERFGYPDFLTASADELVEGQYADRPGLRPILDAVLARGASLGPLTVQARKTYVSLLTPRRTFATVQATTRRRVDLGLRLDDVEPAGRLERATSMGSGSVTIRIPLGQVADVDDEVEAWLRRAYQASA